MNFEAQKLNAIDIMKMMCMLFVIMGHACAIYTNCNWGGIAPTRESVIACEINMFVATFHTQSFVTASGFLFRYLYVEKRKYVNKKRDIRKRSFRLLIPYAIISFFWAIPFAVVIEGSTVKDIVRNYVFMIAPAQLWFCPMLFGVWTIFRLIYKYIEKIPSNVCLVVFFLIYYMVEVVSGYLPIAMFQIKGILMNLLFFYIGVILVDSYDIVFQRKNRCIVYIIECCMSIFFMKYNKVFIINLIIEPIISVCGILAVYCLSIFLSNYLPFNAQGIKILKENSMGVYLLHQQIMYIFLLLFNKPNVLPFFTIIISCVGTTIVSFVMCAILRNCKIGRIALGG